MAARLSLITRVPGAGCIITARQVEFRFLCGWLFSADNLRFIGRRSQNDCSTYSVFP
jgi:hypothetical protein